MPFALDPDARIDVWLPSDEAKPKETRPTFFARFASIKERRRIVQAMDDACALKTAGEQFEKLSELLDRVFAGWKNVADPANGSPLDFSAPEKWLDIFIDGREMLDLLDAWLARTRLSAEERRGFGLPAPSAGATSAGDAPQPEAAPTSPPQPITAGS